MILFGLFENRVLRLYSGVLQSDAFRLICGYRVSGVGDRRLPVVRLLFGFQYLSGLRVDFVIVLIACRSEFHLIDKPAVIVILFGLVENRVLRLYSGVLQSDGFCFFGGYRVSGVGDRRLHVVRLLFGFQYLSGFCVDLVIVLIACRFEFHLIDYHSVLGVESDLKLPHIAFGDRGMGKSDVFRLLRADVQVLARLSRRRNIIKRLSG